MHHFRSCWIRIFPAVFYLACFGLTLSNPQAPAAESDEAAIRRLAHEFYSKYAQEDMDGFISLWNTQSPDLKSRRQMATIFLPLMKRLR